MHQHQHEKSRTHSIQHQRQKSHRASAIACQALIMSRRHHQHASSISSTSLTDAIKSQVSNSKATQPQHRYQKPEARMVGGDAPAQASTTAMTKNVPRMILCAEASLHSHVLENIKGSQHETRKRKSPREGMNDGQETSGVKAQMA